MVWGKGPNVFFGTWQSSYSSIICWRNSSFPVEWTWQLHQKSIGHRRMGLLSAFSSVLTVQPCPSTGGCFPWGGCVAAQLGGWSPPTLTFFFKSILAIQGPSQFPMNLRIGVFISPRNEFLLEKWRNFDRYSVFVYSEVLPIDVVKWSILSPMILGFCMLFREVFPIPRL